MSPAKVTTSSSTPLSQRSPNLVSPRKSNTASPGKPKTMDDNTSNNDVVVAISNDKPVPRFELPSQTKTNIGHPFGQDQTTTTYISPSDAIRSPTTKKLSQIKGKRYQSAKPQTLFAKTLSKQGFLKARQIETDQQKGGNES